MIQEQGLRSCPPETSGRALAPVLIQVPQVPALTRGSGRPYPRARVQPSVRPRRRLRREVRMAGYLLLAALPLSLLALGFWGGRRSVTAGSMSSPSDLAHAHRPPVISISIEPAGAAKTQEPETPVVFPGYLLPDDGSEEPAHAGS